MSDANQNYSTPFQKRQAFVNVQFTDAALVKVTSIFKAFESTVQIKNLVVQYQDLCYCSDRLIFQIQVMREPYNLSNDFDTDLSGPYAEKYFGVYDQEKKYGYGFMGTGSVLVQPRILKFKINNFTMKPGDVLCIKQLRFFPLEEQFYGSMLLTYNVAY